MKTVTFGEIMLRLAPQNNLRFLQEPSFQATFGGGEANVAVSLCNFQDSAEFVSKLPSNDIGIAAKNSLRAYGVETSNIAFGNGRMGIYYLEKGASQRPSKVIYDRANSAFSLSNSADYDWEKIFENADWFHFTGITPALSDNLVAIVENALIEAKIKGITVSCDLNYRKKLWSREKANEVMSNLMKYVDVCIGNEEDAADVFGIKAEESDVTSGKIDKESYKSVAKKLTEKFGFKAVAITLRQSISASDNVWSAMLYQNGKSYMSKSYNLHIVDRVGGGDSFGAGLIYAMKNGKSAQDAIEFAVAASALKHSIEGDFNRVSLSEVESLLKDGGSGRVQR